MMKMRNYKLNIRLLGVEPYIWRQISVPGTISLDRLHDVIQIVMGWQDEHLYCFNIAGNQYSETFEDCKNSVTSRLSDLLNKIGSSFEYVYDFGDNWQHLISIEDTDYPTHESGVPIVCIDGSNDCPPESVGGVEGYHRYCEAAQSCASNQAAALPESSKEDVNQDIYAFDKTPFNLNSVNKFLERYCLWQRPRHYVFAEPLFYNPHQPH